MTIARTRDYVPAGLHEPKAMRANTKPWRVLALVDGTEGAGRVLKCLLDLHTRTSSIDVVLLNVQPAPVVGRLRGYGSFRRAEVEDRLINELGKRAITSAGRHLDAAGIGHKDRIELGEPAETVIRCANEEKCDLIVLAEPKPGPVRQWLMRNSGVVIHSVAGIVTHLASAPVLIAR
jgi:nucleotide-binding universal stress UspA family protein